LQERAKYLDEWQPLADIYDPWRWDVSQKSDVWGVGLAALYLLWAGKGEEACLQLERDIRDESAGWINEFNDNVPSDESTGDNEVLIEWIEMYEFDPAYSIGLVHLVRRCLSLRPIGRPLLREMKITIDRNIARLNGLYGEDIRKPRGTIYAGHRVLVHEEKFQAFDIGQQP
jgi:hypothetical protein